MLLKELIVLLAEDQDDDVALFTRAITRVVGRHTIRVVPDGAAAISYLRGEGLYGDRAAYPFPNVLLLDIKMPRVSGLDVLRWLHDHPDCSIIPSIVFTSSEQPQDIKEAYVLGANAYFCKPVVFDELQELLGLVFQYWFKSHVPEPPPEKVCR